MCNKIKAYEKEGIAFLLTLPVKHKNRIKIEILNYLKIMECKHSEKEEITYEKCRNKH